MNRAIEAAASADVCGRILPGNAADLRSQTATRRMRMGGVASIALAGAILLATAAPKVSATVTPPPEIPIDVMDIYTGIVALDMNKCCDCHRVECR